MKHEFEKYCKDYQDIENYEKAKKDNFTGWHCHHRLETHTPDGKRRDADIGYKELKALGLYYNRPAEELIFLTTREHNAFKKGKPGYWKGKTGPNKGKKMSEEFCRKNSESHKGKQAGENHPMYGKKHSDETIRKMRESHKGKHVGNTATKGMHWYNNGKINKRAKECPPGFTPGRLRK